MAALRTALAMAAPSSRALRLPLENSSLVVACASPHPSQLRCIRRTGFLQLKPSLQQRAVLVCHAGGRRDGKRPRSGMQARRKQQPRREDDDDDDAAAEKALEALFAQLEMDLNSEDDDGEEFTDEELEQMSRELEAVFSGIDLEGLEDDEEEEEEDEEEEDEEAPGVVDMVMTDGVYSEASGAANKSIQRTRQIYEEDEGDDEVDEEEYDEDDDEERMVPLEKWQIRKLAAAAEKGRRNVNVKSLAAEIGMDRSDVLSFLKDPPPELLLIAAQWDSEDAKAAAAGRASIPELGFEFKVNVVDEPPSPAASSRRPPPTPSGGPQAPRSWHGAKRLKKEHIATFERVYRQSHRPSNAMIENLVNLTHVPRKKILQWFDEKRAENQHGKQSFGEASEN